MRVLRTVEGKVSPNLKDLAAAEIYSTIQDLEERPAWHDLGTEREVEHRHIGSSTVRERLYQLVDRLAEILEA